MRSISFASASARRFLAAGIIPVLLVAVLLGMRLAETQRAAAELRNSLTAATVQAEVESFLATPEVALTQISTTETPDDMRQLMAHTLTKRIESVESIFIIGPDKRVVNVELDERIGANEQDFLGLDRSRDPLVIAATDSRALTWSGVFTSSVSGNRVIGLALPFGEYVAEATIDIETLSDFLEQADLAEGTTVVIADDGGNVLFHSSPEIARLRPNWSGVEPIAAGSAGRIGRFDYELDGTEMLGSTALVKGPRWTVLVQNEEAVAMRPVIEVWTGLAALMLVVVVAATAGALLFSRGLSRPIASLTTVASAIEAGDYAAPVPRLKFKELDELGRYIDSMAVAVRERESDLLASRQRLAKESAEKSEALGKLSTMSAELTVTEERERRRLAEELHDRVSQVLAVARMRLGLANKEGVLDVAELSLVSELLGEAVAQTRAITTELASPVLYEIGLGAAVTDCCTRMETQHGIEMHVDIVQEPLFLNDDVKMAMYRAARELVMNVVKHSGASEAWVRLDAQDGVAILEVRDSGRGMIATTSTEGGGFGLFSIRERLTHLNGALDIESQPDDGTTVTVRIPC